MNARVRFLLLLAMLAGCAELRSGRGDAGRDDAGQGDACVGNRCDSEPGDGDDGGGDAGGEGDGDASGDGDGEGDGEACVGRDKLDLLLVIDRSRSMEEERMQLAGQLQDLVRALLSGDVDADGEPEFEGFQSLQVGAITSDLGAGTTDPAFSVLIQCEIPGDDAKLIDHGNPTDVGCAERYSPPFVSAVPASGVSEVAAQDLECMIRAVPNDGCGLEHPLEAALKALSTASEPWRFLWTDAQGDRANAGFLRDDAMLAVLVVSDEDDCSQQDIDAARPLSPRFEDLGMNLRCAMAPQTLMPLSRYYHGLRGLKERASDVVYGAIAGVPEDLVEDRAPGVYRRALEDARMDVRVEDPGDPNAYVEDACQREEGQGAAPGRRLIELADMFGERGVVQSMCAESIRASLRVFASVIGEAVSNPDCGSDACPCEAPFECIGGRCTCDAQVSCPAAACDPIPDGCGGARDCGGCPGTLTCGSAGVANACGVDPDCAEGHVCAELLVSGTPTSATVWLFEDEPLSAGVLDISKRIETNVFGPVTVSPKFPGTFQLDLDLNGWTINAYPSAHLVIVLAEHDLATTPVASGDRYYLYPRELSFGSGWVVNTGSAFESASLLPMTPDDAATPGHESEDIVQCNAEPCATFCCDSMTCGGDNGACEGVMVQCDGPEDCPGMVCCHDGSTAYCTPSCPASQLCHAMAHCPEGNTCQPSWNSDYGTCVVAQ